MKRLLPVLCVTVVVERVSDDSHNFFTHGTFECPGCDSGPNQDVFGGLAFMTSNPFNAKDYGCAIVSKADGFPVFDGTQSARFEVRPGDCSANKDWDDCPNDRSRHEIQERWPDCVGCRRESTEGQLLTYELMVYVPSKPQVRPRGKNALNLAQINVMNRSVFTALAFLKFHDGLRIKIHHKFNIMRLKRKYLALEDPLDKWTKVKFEVKSTTDGDGYLKVFVNDELKVHEIRPTLPTSDAETDLKFGIYNSFLSRAMEPYGKQIVYFDAISKSVKKAPTLMVYRG